MMEWYNFDKINQYNRKSRNTATYNMVRIHKEINANRNDDCTEQNRRKVLYLFFHHFYTFPPGIFCTANAW